MQETWEKLSNTNWIKLDKIDCLKFQSGIVGMLETIKRVAVANLLYWRQTWITKIWDDNEADPLLWYTINHSCYRKGTQRGYVYMSQLLKFGNWSHPMH